MPNFLRIGILNVSTNSIRVPTPLSSPEDAGQQGFGNRLRRRGRVKMTLRILLMIDYFAITVIYFGGEWLKSYLRQKCKN